MEFNFVVCNQVIFIIYVNAVLSQHDKHFVTFKLKQNKMHFKEIACPNVE